MSAVETVLVTGASNGIGLELACEFARDGRVVAITGRDRAALTQAAEEIGRAGASRVVAFVAELGNEAGIDAFLAELEHSGLRVDVLVNNAGFGGVGAFCTRSRDDDMRMVAVNVVALTDLTKLLVPGMVQRRRGRVLNVASTAAFQPGPFMAVYYATKAYVLSLSQALAEELSGTGVTVTCLCPGPTESEFHAVAGTDAQPLTATPLTMSASSVAEAGYRAMMRGKLVEVPGLHNKIGAQTIRIAPRRAVLKVVRRLHPAEH